MLEIKTGRRRGFTLVELLVTLAILAIIMGLALPSLSSWFVRQRLSAAVSDVSDTLRFARTQAISRQQQVWLSIGVQDGWQLKTALAQGDDCSRALRCSGSEDFGGVSLSGSGLPRSIAFSPLRGLPLSASGAPLGEFRLILSHPGCEDVSVTLLPTGLVYRGNVQCR